MTTLCEKPLSKRKIVEYNQVLSNDSFLYEDEHIEVFYNLMARQRNIDESKINFIKPCLIVDIIHFGMDKATQKEYNTQCDGRDIIIIPICHHNHWSLLIEKRAINQWYHIDSCGRYHEEYVTKVLSILNGSAQRIPIISPRQRGGKECGIYILFYALIIITNPSSFKQWTLDVSHVKEENRHQFIDALRQLLEQEEKKD